MLFSWEDDGGKVLFVFGSDVSLTTQDLSMFLLFLGEFCDVNLSRQLSEHACFSVITTPQHKKRNYQTLAVVLSFVEVKGLKCEALRSSCQLVNIAKTY